MSESDLTHGRGAVAALAASVAVLAVIQAATLWSGALGMSLGFAGALVILLVAIASAVGLVRAFAGEARSVAVRPHVESPRWAKAVAAVAVAWCAALYLRLWILALHRPVYDWDGLYYHVPALNAWVVGGHVGWIANVVDVPFVNYPMGPEALTFFVHRLATAAADVTATNLWFWPLGFFALVVIATQLGARGPWAWMAGALMGGIPVIVTQSVTCYTDPAFAFTVMAALAACSMFALGERPTLARTALLGASVGLMAGAKGGGAPFALVSLVVTGVVALFAHRGRDAVRWVLALAGVAVLAFAVGGYWYARAVYHTGNPIYPIELKIGAMVLKPGFDHVAFSAANMPDWLRDVAPFLRMPMSWLQHDAPIQSYAPIGGLGYLWVSFALPAWVMLVAFRLRHRGDAGGRPLALLSVLVAMLLAIQTAPWWSRFTIWLHALGLPALAVFLQLLSTERDRLVRVFGIVAMLTALGVAAWESERTLSIEWARGRAEGETRSAAYTSTMDSFFPGLSDSEYQPFLAADHLARTPWSRAGTLLGGLLAMPLGSRDIQVLPAHVTESVADSLQTDGEASGAAGMTAGDVDSLRTVGVTWVIWDELAAGPAPERLTTAALENLLWAPGPGARFRFVRIASDRDAP